MCPRCCCAVGVQRPQTLRNRAGRSPAELVVLRDLLVNGEVKETTEAFGLGIGNRDIWERVCHPLSDGTRISEW